MQLIQSLLRLQSNDVINAEHKKPLIDSTNRIKSMSLIHEILYRSDDMSHLDTEAYFKSIVQHLLKIYQQLTVKIDIDFQVDPVDMDMDRCVSCGLIINELVSNALKYAFKDAINGKISICLTKTSLNQIVLSVMDDGCGIPSNLKIEESESLGLKIVNLLAIGQLKGKLTIDSKTGTRFDIQFPLVQKE